MPWLATASATPAQAFDGARTIECDRRSVWTPRIERLARETAPVIHVRRRRPRPAVPPLPIGFWPVAPRALPGTAERTRRSDTTLLALAACALFASMFAFGWQLGHRPSATPRVLELGVAPAPPLGGLRVAAAHHGVSLWVDGELRGELPLALDELVAGDHMLRFDAGDKFEVVDQRVTIAAGRSIDLGVVALPLRYGTVTVAIGTLGAQVWLNDASADARGGKQLDGPWPRTFEVAPGDYELVVARRGFRSVVRPFTIAPESPERRMDVTLRPTDWLRHDLLEL